MASILKKVKGSRKSATFTVSSPGPENDDKMKRLEISSPTDFKHNVHVGLDPVTGKFVGIPAAWNQWLETSQIRYGVTVLAAVSGPRL